MEHPSPASPLAWTTLQETHQTRKSYYEECSLVLARGEVKSIVIWA